MQKPQYHKRRVSDHKCDMNIFGGWKSTIYKCRPLIFEQFNLFIRPNRFFVDCSSINLNYLDQMEQFPTKINVSSVQKANWEIIIATKKKWNSSIMEEPLVVSVPSEGSGTVTRGQRGHDWSMSKPKLGIRSSQHCAVKGLQVCCL